jgi:hypothetical protein
MISMDAEWHFFALHGKGACDGVAGTIRKASLQNPYEEQIMTPRQLYEWAVVKIPSVTFLSCTVEDHSKEMMMLEGRFRKAQTLPGTKKYTVSFLPQKTTFRQKCFQKQMCSTPHI